jgi:hypothetical protein
MDGYRMGNVWKAPQTNHMQDLNRTTQEIFWNSHVLVFTPSVSPIIGFSHCSIPSLQNKTLVKQEESCTQGWALPSLGKEDYRVTKGWEQHCQYLEKRTTSTTITGKNVAWNSITITWKRELPRNHKITCTNTYIIS